jgi:hypothetical protein
MQLEYSHYETRNDILGGTANASGAKFTRQS